MTDQEFLGYFAGGLDVQGQRVTARFGKLAPEQAIRASLDSSQWQFVIQVNHGDEIPMSFERDEHFSTRMAKVDAAVERWLVLRQ